MTAHYGPLPDHKLHSPDPFLTDAGLIFDTGVALDFDAVPAVVDGQFIGFLARIAWMAVSTAMTREWRYVI